MSIAVSSQKLNAAAAATFLIFGINGLVFASWAARIPAADFRSARIGLVGRNLWTNTKYTGYDPDVTAPGGGNPFAYRVDYFTYPAYRSFTAMLELGF